MRLSKGKEQTVYTVVGVTQGQPCQNCTPCMKLRLIELGLYEGENVMLVEKKLGLCVINLLTSNNNITSTLALRNEEAERVMVV